MLNLLFLVLLMLMSGSTIGFTITESNLSNETMWSSLKVSLVQYPLEGNLSVHQLYSKVKNFIAQAAQEGAEIVLIPELFSLDLLDFSKPETEQFDAIIEETQSLTTEIQNIANELNVYVLAGSTPVKVKSKIRNRSFLFGPHKKPVYQDKIFLTPDEVEWGWEGADSLTVIRAPWGNTAIVICYDSEFPLISQTLAQQNINLFLIPSMTGEPGFTRVRWAAQARAIEHMAYVMVTGTSGAPAPGWEMKAQAAVLGPSLSGFTPTIAEGELNKDNEIVFATLNMSTLVAAKLNGDYYPAFDQKDMMTIDEEFVVML